MSNQPKAIMMIGLPGSGKTSWVNDYLKTTNAVVLSTDDLIEDWAREHDLTYSEAFKLVDFKAIKNQMMGQMQEAIANNQDIIIDQTNMSRKNRRGKLLRIPSHYHKIAVIVDIPNDILRARLAERATQTGKFIPNKVLSDMQNSFEAPNFDEFDQVIHV